MRPSGRSLPRVNFPKDFASITGAGFAAACARLAGGVDRDFIPILKALRSGCTDAGRFISAFGTDRARGISIFVGGAKGVAVSATFFQSSRSSGRSFLAIPIAPKSGRALLGLAAKGSYDPNLWSNPPRPQPEIPFQRTRQRAAALLWRSLCLEQS